MKLKTNQQTELWVCILQSTRLNEAGGFFVFPAILGYSIVSHLTAGILRACNLSVYLVLLSVR